MNAHREGHGRRQSFLSGRAGFGFTLLEVAVALAVLGLIASAAASAYLGLFSANRSNLNGEASLSSLSGAVLAFAKSRHRLPCPDADGSGRESLVNGVCPADLSVGWFPYLSAGLSSPAPLTRSIYGVYRATGADLARTEEHSGDAVGAASYADLADLIRALRQAASQATAATRIYLTGDGAASGLENCTTHVASNPAFVLLATGEDRDGDGKATDGIHATLPGNGRCFAAPTRGADSTFDDRTLAVSFYELMAKLNNDL